MRWKLIVVLAILPAVAMCQDYPQMAKDIQQKYKTAEAYILKSTSDFLFTKDAVTGAKVTINQNKSLLSLRYNSWISKGFM